jgi:hypothetical protein
VPSLVPIKKREGGRRPPWIGCKLCLDLNEIFLVCILCRVCARSENFPLIRSVGLGLMILVDFSVMDSLFFSSISGSSLAY